VKGTIDYGITYREEVNLNLVGYVNSDYTGCKDTRRLTKGIFLLLQKGQYLGRASIRRQWYY